MPITLRGSGQVIVQIVQATTTTSFSNSSNDVPTDILSASITPTSSSNRIYICARIPIRISDANATGNHEAQGQTILYRNTTVIDNEFYGMYVQNETRPQNISVYAGHNFIDSPATTSSITYKIAINSTGTGYVISCPLGTFAGNTASIGLILMEISQ